MCYNVLADALRGKKWLCKSPTWVRLPSSALESKSVTSLLRFTSFTPSTGYSPFDLLTYSLFVCGGSLIGKAHICGI